MLFTIAQNKSHFDIVYRTFRGKFDSRSPQARSPGQVTGQLTQSPKKTVCNHVTDTSGGEEDLKIGGFGIPSGTYILCISEFLYD